MESVGRCLLAEHAKAACAIALRGGNYRRGSSRGARHARACRITSLQARHHVHRIDVASGIADL
jgi:hypothetical protein